MTLHEKKNSYTHCSNREIQFDFFPSPFSARAMRNGLNANKNYDAFLERVETKRASMQKPQSTMVLTCIISKNYDWIAIKKLEWSRKKRLSSALFLIRRLKRWFDFDLFYSLLIFSFLGSQITIRSFFSANRVVQLAVVKRSNVFMIAVPKLLK